MKTAELEVIVDQTLQRVAQTLKAKGAEYAPKNDDRLHNFVVGAQLQGITPKEALMGYLTKHLVSVGDMVKDPIEMHSMDTWDEKIGDSLVYLVLLRAVVESEKPPLDRTPYSKIVLTGTPATYNETFGEKLRHLGVVSQD